MKYTGKPDKVRAFALKPGDVIVTEKSVSLVVEAMMTRLHSSLNLKVLVVQPGKFALSKQNYIRDKYLRAFTTSVSE